MELALAAVTVVALVWVVSMIHDAVLLHRAVVHLDEPGPGANMIDTAALVQALRAENDALESNLRRRAGESDAARRDLQAAHAEIDRLAHDYAHLRWLNAERVLDVAAQFEARIRTEPCVKLAVVADPHDAVTEVTRADRKAPPPLPSAQVAI